jgi:pectate lyase
MPFFSLTQSSLLFGLALSLAGAAAAQDKKLPAFPGAEGFGALASGGRSGAVVHVTNLNDSGPGSFREAVSKPGRTVVFDIGGVIKIASKIAVASDITIAGETAPGEGITIYGEGVSFSGQKNIIVRYIRIRQGIKGSRGGKSLNVAGGSDMIFDHVSAQWGRWDSGGVTEKATRITLQNSLIGESIDPQRFGALFDSVTQVTIARNLWLDNQSRNPKVKGDIQYINNVVYNWGVSGVTGGHSAAEWHQDMVNNLFIKGPSTTGSALALWAKTDNVFQQGNEIDSTPDGKLQTQPITEADFKGDTPPTFHPTPFNTPPVPVTVLSVAEAFQKVLAGAGASLHRDAVDNRLCNDVKSLGTTGQIVKDETTVGGQPEVTPVSRPAGFDSDGDGLPDTWERSHRLNPNDASDGNKLDGSGYTQLELYLHSLTGGQ